MLGPAANCSCASRVWVCCARSLRQPITAPPRAHRRRTAAASASARTASSSGARCDRAPTGRSRSPDHHRDHLRRRTMTAAQSTGCLLWARTGRSTLATVSPHCATSTMRSPRVPPTTLAILAAFGPVTAREPGQHTGQTGDRRMHSRPGPLPRPIGGPDEPEGRVRW